MTTDIVFTARKSEGDHCAAPTTNAAESVDQSVAEVLRCHVGTAIDTPSRVYIAVVRRYIERRWDLEPLHLQDILAALQKRVLQGLEWVHV